MPPHPYQRTGNLGRPGVCPKNSKTDEPPGTDISFALAQQITADGYWEEFRQRVRAINPDAYIVGEVWEDSSDYIVGGTRFDATMNYLLTVEIISFAAGGHIDADEIVPNPAYATVAPIDAAEYSKRIDKLFARYPMESHLANLNLLESHDTAHLLNTSSEDKASLVLSTLLTMTFPGAPCDYGSEVGVAGSFDPDCRRAFPWNETEWDMDLLQTHREFTALRHAHPARRAPGYRTVSTDGHLYVFERFDDTERLLTAVNAGEEASAAAMTSGFELLWGNPASSPTGITVPGRSGAVWRVL